MNKRALIVAGILGFFAPVICAVIDMLLFSLKDSFGVDFFAYTLPRIVCPAWLIANGSPFWFVAMPLINAATYVGITMLFLKTKELFATRPHT